MKNKNLLKEVNQFKKIAGLLKEDTDSEKRDLIISTFEGLEMGDPITNLRENISKIFPEYAQKLEEFAMLEGEIYNRLEKLYADT